MKRVTDWRLALDRQLAARRDYPWRWGVHDCCAFAAGVVAAVTGRDVFAPWRATYADAAGAAAALERAGGLAAILTATFGAPCRPLSARAGDLVVVQLSQGERAACATGVRAVGIVDGGRVYIAAAPRGLGQVPLELASAAWRVG